MLGATFAVIGLIAASQRVIGWVLAAATMTGLVYPIVATVARVVHRGLAILVVVIVLGAFAGLVTFESVTGAVASMHRLQRAAPAAAARLERRGRFHEALRSAHLADRTRRLVREAPRRLQGGTPAAALRSATARSLAFLATGVLFIFFLVYGPQLARAASRQVHDPERRERVERVAVAAYRRAFGYARGCIAMSALAGLVAYTAASIAHVPGQAPLALWVALWDLVPLVGAAIGAVPIIGLAAAGSPARAAVLALVFAAYQVIEGLVLQRWVEHRTIRLGPFLTVAGGFAGIELYGIGGAALVLLAITLAAAVADELAPA